MEREGATSGWLLVGEVTLKKKLECQDLGEGQSKGPEVGVSLMCLRTHEELCGCSRGSRGDGQRQVGRAQQGPGSHSGCSDTR